MNLSLATTCFVKASVSSRISATRPDDDPFLAFEPSSDDGKYIKQISSESRWDGNPVEMKILASRPVPSPLFLKNHVKFFLKKNTVDG